MRCKPAGSRLRPRLLRFRRDKKGATAVEFALVAAPFFMLIFAIIETALVFFAGQVLDTGVNEGARLVRTGQAHSQGLDAAGFKNQVCTKVAGLLNCDSRLKIDVRKYDSFGQIDLSQPVDSDGNLIENFTYDIGGRQDIIVVRAFYEWPVLVPVFGMDMSNLANGKRLLASAATFRNEPF